jgi:hypothetical protein
MWLAIGVTGVSAPEIQLGQVYGVLAPAAN